MLTPTPPGHPGRASSPPIWSGTAPRRRRPPHPASAQEPRHRPRTDAGLGRDRARQGRAGIRCRQIILACRPADLPGAAADLPLTARHLVLSAVAAASVADLAALLGGDVSVRRFMPGISVEAGVGAIPLYPGDTRAQALLSALGQVIVAADEAAFDALTAATCAHGWFYSLFDSLISGLEAQGLARRRRGPPCCITRGAAELCLARPDLRPRAISRDVAAPGSYRRRPALPGRRRRPRAPAHRARIRPARATPAPAVTAGHPDLFPDPPTSRHERRDPDACGAGRRPRVVQWQR